MIIASGLPPAFTPAVRLVLRAQGAARPINAVVDAQLGLYADRNDARSIEELLGAPLQGVQPPPYRILGRF